MNEYSSTSSRLFPLPVQFPSTEALKSLQKMKNPEMYLKRILGLDSNQYFKFLQASLEAQAYDRSWYEKNAEYITSLVNEFMSKFADPALLPDPHATLEEFREQLLQKKRTDRIQTLYSSIHSPQDKQELIKKKMLDCLESFLKIRKLAHDNDDQNTLEELKSFFIDQPEICSLIETQTKVERPQAGTIIAKLGDSKNFEKFTLKCSLVYLENCFYPLLKLLACPNLSPTEKRLLSPLWPEVIKFENAGEMCLYFEDKTEALVQLTGDLIGFFISNETIYAHKEAVRYLIETLKELAPIYINRHGSKNLERATTYRTLLALLSKRLEAVITEKEGSPSEWEALTAIATSYSSELPIFIKGKPGILKEICKKVPPLKSLNLVRPPSSELSANEWAELALERVKPHSILIGLYLSEISLDEAEPISRQKTSFPREKWNLEDFINAFQPRESSENTELENLEFLKNLLATSNEPKTYKNFFPHEFEQWYPDLSDFPLGDYINYIFTLHAIEMENYLKQSQNFKNYKTAMIRQQTTAYSLESQDRASSTPARELFEDFITEALAGAPHNPQTDEIEALPESICIPIPQVEKKEKEKEKESDREENESEGLKTFSEEDQKFYNYLEDAPVILATYIANQAAEQEPGKAINTLKIVLLYIDNHRTQIESVAEFLKKKPFLNRDRLRQLLVGSRFLKVLDRLLEE
jgi:hypothetical protein